MDSLTLAISQGSLRRGSAAVYLPVWHPEIEEFVEIRRPTGGDPNRKALNLHHGVLVPDAFMRAVENDEAWSLVSPKDGSVLKTIQARALWIRLLTARIETGEPYLIFSDTVNRGRPGHHKLAGLEVKTSNLCVAPETMLLTEKGEFPIKDLAGQVVNVWNGSEWSPAPVAKTGTNQTLIRVVFSDGSHLDCTPYHKFYLGQGVLSRQAEAASLCPGDRITPFFLPGPKPVYRGHLTVDRVECNGRIDDTYCVNEPLRHKAVFNGIRTGNCAEITLPTGIDHHGRDRTAVCCLSSLNLEYWPEWKDHSSFIPDVMRFLDNVLQDFIDHAPDDMAKAKYSAMRERSVGLGVMGFHSFLQANGVPFESVIAKSWNMKMFRHIREEADRASYSLAYQRGPCPDAADYGFMERFSHKLSIAPTASISIICGGSSPGIEPISANVFLQKTLSGSHTVRNRHLRQLLAEKGHDTDDVWSSITLRAGSVQHLDFLSEMEKLVFKTAFELDQRWIIEHAADRTPLICQSQSVNVFLPANVNKRDLHQIHMMAWKHKIDE